MSHKRSFITGKRDGKGKVAGQTLREAEKEMITLVQGDSIKVADNIVVPGSVFIKTSG